MTPLQSYLAHLQFAEPSRQLQGLSFPWCEAVLYSPDSPFLFGGGSGYETIHTCVAMPHGTSQLYNMA